MGCAQQALLVGSEAPKVYATWNPSDKGSNVALSGGDLTITTSGNGKVRSTIGKTSGKWYWEVTTVSVSSYYSNGLANATSVLTLQPGNDVNSSGYSSAGGQVFCLTVSVATGATYTAGDVMGMAMDADAHTMAWYKNNVLQFTSTLAQTPTGALFASSGGGTAVATANFGATPLVYAPPAGFNAGLYE